MFGICERYGVAATKLSMRIDAERERRGWTYDVLAERLDTSKSTAHGWCAGTHEPNLASLRLIAKTFGWSVAKLIEAA